MIKNDNENKSKEIAIAITYYLFDLEMKEDWENFIRYKKADFKDNILNGNQSWPSIQGEIFLWIAQA